MALIFHWEFSQVRNYGTVQQVRTYNILGAYLFYYFHPHNFRISAEHNYFSDIIHQNVYYNIKFYLFHFARKTLNFRPFMTL